MAILNVTVRVDGSEATDPSFLSTNSCVCHDDLTMRTIWIGPATAPGQPQFLAGTAISYFRNLTVGSTGFGSSDIWNPSFATDWSASNIDPVVPYPPFDSVVVLDDGDANGSPRLFVSGGVLTSEDDHPEEGFPGPSRYTLASKDLGADYTEIYVQFDFKVNDYWINCRNDIPKPIIWQLYGVGGTTAVFPAGSQIGRLHYTANFTTANKGAWVAEALAHTTLSFFNEARATIFPYPFDGLSNWHADTWMTIGLHYWIGVPPGALHLDTG